jgi:alkylation response protein AidB-like acyl-CoA dehydrogenase
MTHDICQQLAQLASAAGVEDAWPGAQFELLAQTGVLGAVIPTEYGGAGASHSGLIRDYVQLAAACLTTTFVLTQRNGACQRIAAAPNAPLKSDLLPRLARGELFATVGISHLTTSRQHWRAPTVRVEQTQSGYVFTGEVPWVTAAPRADYVVTGGTLDDGRQLLAAIPTASQGVTVGPPARLLALSGSETCSVTLEQVPVESHHILAGPVEQVMKTGVGGGTGSFATSALAIGRSKSALARLQEEAARRAELAEIVHPLAAECDQLEADLYRALESDAGRAPALSPEAVRSRANSLALRSTQALLGASKGAGFVCGHPAERAVREAMFFLVWSCPQPVLHAALREFAGVGTC